MGLAVERVEEMVERGREEAAGRGVCLEGKEEEMGDRMAEKREKEVLGCGVCLIGKEEELGNIFLLFLRSLEHFLVLGLERGMTPVGSLEEICCSIVLRGLLLCPGLESQATRTSWHVSSSGSALLLLTDALSGRSGDGQAH